MIMSIGELITENVELEKDNIDQKSLDEEEAYIIFDSERLKDKQDVKNLSSQMQFMNHIQDNDSAQQRITFII